MQTFKLTCVCNVYFWPPIFGLQKGPAQCCGPQDREFISGGSSSGSGVAVALGQVPVMLVVLL